MGGYFFDYSALKLNLESSTAAGAHLVALGLDGGELSAQTSDVVRGKLSTHGPSAGPRRRLEHRRETKYEHLIYETSNEVMDEKSYRDRDEWER